MGDWHSPIGATMLLSRLMKEDATPIRKNPLTDFVLSVGDYFRKLLGISKPETARAGKRREKKRTTKRKGVK